MVPVTEAVFAFGSNMCSARLRDYGVSPVGRGLPAVLAGYRLCFNKRSKDGSGKANVEPDVAGEVWGVLYSITLPHLLLLDDGEGDGYFRRREVIRTRDDHTCGAWVYVAVSTNAGTPLVPYSWYKHFIVDGAREHGLPLNYIESLEAIESAEDSDKSRDRRRRLLQCKAE